MFLAIKGDVNNVYRLQKPDYITIEKYLVGISHTRFRKQKAAYNWVKIDVPDEIPRFQECLKKLKEVGIIDKDEVVVSCSHVQNIEDDEARKKYYEKRKKDILKKKEEKRIKEIQQSKKDFSKIYALNEPKEEKIMPGEFELVNIDATTQKNARGYFLQYFLDGGDSGAFGNFKGKVGDIKKIKNETRILFREIFVEFNDLCGNFIEGKEDHVWIFDCDEFLNMGVEIGDCVKFNAIAYAYRRKNGSVDFGLKAPQCIQYIPDYELPKDDALYLQKIERLVCDICLYNEHCCKTICLAEPDYRKNMTVQLLRLNGTSEDFVDKYIFEHFIPKPLKDP